MRALKAQEQFSDSSSSPNTPTCGCSGQQESTYDLCEAPENSMDSDASTAITCDERVDCPPTVGNESCLTKAYDTVSVQKNPRPLSCQSAIDIGLSSSDNSDTDLRVLSQCNTSSAAPGPPGDGEFYSCTQAEHANSEMPVESMAMLPECSTAFSPWEEDKVSRIQHDEDESNSNVAPPMPQIQDDPGIRSPYDLHVQGVTGQPFNSSVNDLYDSEVESLVMTSERVANDSPISGSASGMDTGPDNLEPPSDKVHNLQNNSSFSSSEMAASEPETKQNVRDCKTSSKRCASVSASAEGTLAVNPVDVLVEILSGLYTAATNESGSGQDRTDDKICTNEPESDVSDMPSATLQDPMNTLTQIATVAATAAGILTGSVAQSLIDMTASPQRGSRRVQACPWVSAHTAGCVSSCALLLHTTKRSAGKQCCVHTASRRGCKHFGDAPARSFA